MCAAKPFALEDPALARRLFGRTMTVSATQVEKFYLCHFQYFCRYGLNARERRAAELDAMEYGSLMHYLLEQFFSKGNRLEEGVSLLTLSEEELETIIRGFLVQYVQAKMGGTGVQSPRMQYLFDRLSQAAAVVIRHIAEELEQSAFKPWFRGCHRGGRCAAAGSLCRTEVP
ncbi:MAG: PD-(D/E)XK nuclease family protein [Hydrogeniiclostridium mannosilyticum]